MNEFTEPKPFQGIGIFRMRKRYKGRAFLADDIGLGKTLQSLLASLPRRAKRAIVCVVPNSVKYQWEHEVKKHTGLNCWVLEGQKSLKKKPFHIPPIIILNWEILQYWTDFLVKLNPSVVIGDEIHYIKTPRSLRSRAFRRLIKESKCRTIYGLSGTPFENRPRELYVILNILRPDVFPRFKEFGNKFCGPKWTPWGITYDGATRIRELNKLLKKTCMVRRTKAQVSKDLPPLTRTTVPIHINRKKYESFSKDIIRYLHRYKPNKAYKGKYLNHLAKFNYLLQATAELKIDKVMDWIDNFLGTTNKKLTVFGHHRAFLEKLHERYKDISVLRYGGMSKRNKNLALNSFIGDPKIRLFLGSITAVGTGTDRLQEVCSDMAMAELHWVGVKLLQVEGRLWRMGQKNPVSIYYLIAEDTVEQTLAKAVYRKQKMFNAIIDNDEDRQEFNIFESVIKDLK